MMQENENQMDAGTASPVHGPRERTATAGNNGNGDDGTLSMRIAGLSALKGLVLYGATLTFAGLYAYFMEQIVVAPSGEPPHPGAALVSVAAALAGILGSAFALAVGVPTRATNAGLTRQLEEMEKSGGKNKIRARARQFLSLEPGGRKSASWPQTIGIWVYALVAFAVAVVYLVNQGETPPTIKALAVAFAGYVVAFMTAAYGLATHQE
jgi:hypothetical protein